MCRGLTAVTQTAYIAQVMSREKNNDMSIKLNQTFVVAIPGAVILSYICSLCHFTLGNMVISPLSSPGFFLFLMYILMVFFNFLLFEEIPFSHRRILLLSSHGDLENQNADTSQVSNDAVYN